MGWLGAMAGAGKGLQDYASIMGENRKLAWEQQQSDIAYQRQLNLEQLRKQNNMEVAKTERQWKLEDYDIAQMQEEKQYQRRQGEDEATYQRRRSEALQDRKLGFEEQLLQMRAQSEIALDLAFEQKEQLMQHTDTQLKEMGVGEDMRRMSMLSIVAPDLFKALSTSTGKGGLSAEDAVRAAGEATDMMKMGLEHWNSMSEEDQNNAKKNLDIGKNEDAATVFAESWTFQRMQSSPVWQTILSGGNQGSPLGNMFGSQEEPMDPSSPKRTSLQDMNEENQRDIMEYATSQDNDPNKRAFMISKLGGEENYNRIMAEATKAAGLDTQPMRNKSEGKGVLESVGSKIGDLKLSAAGAGDMRFREWMKTNYPKENLSKLTDQMEKFYLNKYRQEAMQ